MRMNMHMNIITLNAMNETAEYDCQQIQQTELASGKLESSMSRGTKPSTYQLRTSKLLMLIMLTMA